MAICRTTCRVGSRIMPMAVLDPLEPVQAPPSPGDQLGTSVAEAVGDLRSTVPATGFDCVEIPGRREHRLMLQRRRTGIPIHPAVWKRTGEICMPGWSTAPPTPTPRSMIPIRPPTT